MRHQQEKFMSLTKPSSINFRVSEKDQKVFMRKAAKYGGTSFVLREMIQAFNQDRLILKPNPERPSLYTSTPSPTVMSDQLTSNFPE
jgi:hypothetical protein